MKYMLLAVLLSGCAKSTVNNTYTGTCLTEDYVTSKDIFLNYNPNNGGGYDK